jgi:hypothetical protein
MAKYSHSVGRKRQKVPIAWEENGKRFPGCGKKKAKGSHSVGRKRQKVPIG